MAGGSFPRILFGVWLVLAGHIFPLAVNAAPLEAAQFESSAAAIDHLKLEENATFAEKLLFGSDMVPDPEQAEALLLRLSAKGDIQAKFILGRSYLWGTGVKRNSEAGVRLLAEAANGGHAQAASILGLSLVWGVGTVPADPAKAQSLLEQASASGDLEGKLALAEQLLTGWVFKPDAKRAETILNALIADGDLKAKFILGRSYFWGKPDRSRVQEGVALLTSAADEGSSDAAGLLGEAYLWGSDGLVANSQKALNYLTLASDSGNLAAKRILGEQLLTGWVLKRDATKGESLLKALVQGGDARATGILGTAYLYGQGVRYNEKLAMKYLRDAAAASDAAAQETLGSKLMWSGRSKGDREEAQRLLAAAGEAGRPSAWLTLAQGATYGKFSGAGNKRYGEFIKRAKNANVDGVVVLEAQRLLWGFGTKANPKQAMISLNRALDQNNKSAFDFLIDLNRKDWKLSARQKRVVESKYVARFKVAGSKTKNEPAAPAPATASLNNNQIVVDAAQLRYAEAVVRLGEAIIARPEQNTLELERQIYRANPNLALYVAQHVLHRNGLYDGPQDGLSTMPTILAMRKACNGAFVGLICASELISETTIASIASYAK